MQYLPLIHGNNDYLHERADMLRLYVHCLSFKFYIRDRPGKVLCGRMFCELLIQPTPISPIRSSARDALYGRSKYLIPRTSQEKQQFPRESSPRWTNPLKRRDEPGTPTPLTNNSISCNKITHSVLSLRKIHTSTTQLCTSITYFSLSLLDSASSWYLNKDRPTWWHLFYYLIIYRSTCFEC